MVAEPPDGEGKSDLRKNENGASDPEREGVLRVYRMAHGRNGGGGRVFAGDENVNGDNNHNHQEK